MSFADEREAFRAYADAMPGNAVFLVDTYGTLDGVRHAVEAGRRLRAAGHEMIGIRLDSGDLAYLSIEARKILDEGGFPDATILASSELDEHVIASLKDQGAKIGAWGVGTRLVTGHPDPALGGVYKIAAVRRPGEPWRPTIKVSEQAVKTTTPGIQQVRRFARAEDGEFAGDMIFDEATGIASPDEPTIVDPADMTRRKTFPKDAAREDLLVPIFRAGKPVYEPPPIGAARDRTRAQLARFHEGIKRFLNPHLYPVGLEASLFDLKTRLILEARGRGPAA
jgi:nicotinate phosphoribosyltransferase